MMKKRSNPFSDMEFDSVSQVAQAPALVKWEWDLTGYVKNNHGPVSFNKLLARKEFYRPLLSAAWKEWVECVPSLEWATVYRRRYALFCFEAFLLERANHIMSIGEVTTELIEQYREHIYATQKSKFARANHRQLFKLFEMLRGPQSPVPNCIANTVEIPMEPLTKMDWSSHTPVLHASEWKTAKTYLKKKISAMHERLRSAQELLKNGSDPSLGPLANKKKISVAWQDSANVLWYVTHILKGVPPYTSSTKKLRENRQVPLFRERLVVVWRGLKTVKRDRAYKDIRDIFVHLYPTAEDISILMVLFGIETGMNPESIETLTVTSIVGKTPNRDKTLLRYLKNRGSHEEITKSFDDRGPWSPIGILKTVLRITEPLRMLASPEDADRMWLFHKCRNNGEYAVGALDGESALLQLNGQQSSKRSRRVGAFERDGIVDAQGKPLKFNFRILRKTAQTENYIKDGDLYRVSKRGLNHHGKEALNTSAIHYLTNETTKPIHEQTIRTAQEVLIRDALQSAQVLVASAPETKEELSALAKQLKGSEAMVESLFSGGLDLFVSQCRDFYNPPGGKPNTPCSDPWQCFNGCSNALWTSRILPKLIAFRGYMEQRRQVMSEKAWRDAFHIPYTSITEEIIPKFPLHTIEWATAVSKDEPFYVPPTLKQVS